MKKEDAIILWHDVDIIMGLMGDIQQIYRTKKESDYVIGYISGIQKVIRKLSGWYVVHRHDNNDNEYISLHDKDDKEIAGSRYYI